MSVEASAMRAFVLTTMLVCGCSPASTEDQRGAQIRYLAKDIYSSLHDPSCSAPQGFDRPALLQHEMKAMADFGQEIAGTVAAQHLALARQDATYEQSADSRCGADDDIQSAEMHIQMAKDALRVGLPKLRELSRSLRGRQIDQPAESPNQADFRYFVKKLIARTRPMCPIGTGERDNEILAPARKAVNDYHQRLIDGPFAHQFEISDADVAYVQSITLVECDEPSDEPTEKLAAEILANTRTELSAVRKAMN